MLALHIEIPISGCQLPVLVMNFHFLQKRHIPGWEFIFYFAGVRGAP